MAAVVSLTPAPVIDRTYFVDVFDAGKVNRATEIQEFLSGKGINVSRTLRVAGVPTSAVLPIGREDEHLLFRTPHPQILRILPIPGRMRVNTAILETNGRTTNVNQQAVPIPQRAWDDVIEMAVNEIQSLRADWLVVSGSIPRHPETDEKVDLGELFSEARRLGTRVAFDSSGSSLEKWANSGLVDLIKPNADEIATLVGRHLETVGDVLEAGREVVENSGLEVALVSMGGDGALAITRDEAWWGYAPAREVVNTTGAGDASLAGFVGHSIQGRGQAGGRVDFGTLPKLSLQKGLRHAVMYGALAVEVPTTIIESMDTLPQATVERPDPDKPLSEPTKFFETPSA
ncbi:1-phosphofructokinase family hexose kinase [Gulosibacter hominis]|uniref:1-phosphofructokinase family hexose kinase n=1 Tax=Gulosibacter hominis TaxID=2770504 RepID=UPI00191A0FBC|nr:PfkB family carbohydrate kinase [Gulosibacter hominis]